MYSNAFGADPNFLSTSVLGLRIDATTYPDAVSRIMSWANREESRAVSAANVHVVMEAHDAPEFQKLVNACDLVTADGMPLVWFLRRTGIRNATRVYGPDLTLHLLEAAGKSRTPVGFYGGSTSALRALVETVNRRFPSVPVVFSYSPPFRALSPEEDAAIVRVIGRSGARILFVGLGCPKQEEWISQHRGVIPAVMLGVGAAFDFLSGAKMQAPKWMQRNGLEWIFRLASEPRRLIWRYVRHNPRFLYLATRQLLQQRIALG